MSATDYGFMHSVKSKERADNASERYEEKYMPIDMIEPFAMSYGEWLRTNCLVSRNGWTSSSVPYLWEGEISNEKAYEMYLESLKNK